MSGIYLVQPDILIGTDRYKYGMTKDLHKKMKLCKTKNKEIIRIYVSNEHIYKKNLTNALKIYHFIRHNYIEHNNINELIILFMNIIRKTRIVMRFLDNIVKKIHINNTQ